MRPGYPAELRHGICKSNTNTGSYRSFERANPFWPDDGVCRSSAGGRYNQGKILED
jgi:hypothetical protein